MPMLDRIVVMQFESMKVNSIDARDYIDARDCKSSVETS